jgi:hypothetical protein
MLAYRDASLEDREDFSGMNDFDTSTPPLIADFKIDGIDAQVTVANSDDDDFRLEIHRGGQLVMAHSEDAGAKLMVMLKPEMSMEQLLEVRSYCLYGLYGVQS